MSARRDNIASVFMKNLISKCFYMSQACYENEPYAFLQQKGFDIEFTTVLDGYGRYILACCQVQNIVGDAENFVICATRGSKYARDWIQNAKVLPAILRGEPDVHSGWYSRSNEIHPHVQQKVREGYIPIFTGHSLGGAVAQILLYRHMKDSGGAIPIQMASTPLAVTFAAPAPFRPDLASKIKETFGSSILNFYMGTDIVPSSTSILHNFVEDDGTVENTLAKELLKYEPTGINVQLPSDDWDPIANHKLSKLSLLVMAFLPLFHWPIMCNVCMDGFFIIGRRYCCKDCHDYDLCEKCYDKGYHENSHRFLKFDQVESQPSHLNPRNEANTLAKMIFEPYTHDKSHEGVPTFTDCEEKPCMAVFCTLLGDQDSLENHSKAFCQMWIDDFKKDLEQDGIDGSRIEQMIKDMINMEAVAADATAKFLTIIHRYSHRNPSSEVADDDEEFLKGFRRVAWQWASNESVQDVRVFIVQKVKDIAHGIGY